ncbi:MAG TPA: hypothetical protein VNI84_06210 [Pyrinomonadaceae bacterium]|nr:hypothetical protein [Pyrinomonadaceae bacterium]
MRTLYSFCFFLFVFLFASLQFVEACSCMSAGPPCQSFWNTDTVFSGQVVEIKDTPVKPAAKADDKQAFVFPTRTVRFAVGEYFRGTAEKSVEIETGMGGGDCGIAFENGQSYLVYAYRNKETGKLGTGICTRTQVLSKASEDLEYFRGLKDAKAGGTVYGKVTKYLVRKSDDEYKPNPPLQNILLTFAGNGNQYKATTDDKGEYRLSNLAAGEYSLSIKVPEGMWGFEKEEKIKVPDKGCVVTYHALSTKTFLSGKILNEEAAPAAKIMVSLIPLDQINERYQKDTHFDFTDEEGRYTFKSIPDGTYYLGVRIDRSNETTFPYPRTFYPGTTDLKNAVPVTISEGQTIENFDFALSKKLTTRTIRGTVTMPDGKPAAKAYICIEEVEYSEGSTCGGGVGTDDKGQFIFTAMNGLRYLIRSHINIQNNQRHAEPLEIPADGDVSGVKLVITEAGGSCEKCRTWKRRKN